MIKNPETARRVLELLEESSSKLTDSLETAHESCSEEEYMAYLGEVSQVLGRIFYLILDPIYREHPGLVPADGPQQVVERWRAEREGSS
jgi:hypothetical protein